MDDGSGTSTFRRRALFALLYVAGLAVVTFVLIQTEGDPSEDAARQPAQRNTPSAAPTAAPTPAAPVATEPAQKERPDSSSQRPSRERERPERRERERRRGDAGGAPTVPRGYDPQTGEAVVPNRAHCTGPDVFDQPGCETVAAP